MSWYSSSWAKRAPIAVDNTGGSSGGADVTITIPPGFDDFWDNVAVNGYDVIITGSDGATLTTFKRLTWTPGSKQGVLQVDNYVLTASTMQLLWLYWQGDSTSDLAGSFTASTPKTGYVTTTGPGPVRIRSQHQRPGATLPAQPIAKGSGETLDVWWSTRQLLTMRRQPSANSLVEEEIDRVAIQVLSSGSDQASMHSDADTRFVETNDRQLYVRTRLAAGADDTDYTPELSITTTDGQILKPRCLLQVRNVDE